MKLSKNRKKSIFLYKIPHFYPLWGAYCINQRYYILGTGLATLIPIPLGCIVTGAILGHLPPAGCHQ